MQEVVSTLKVIIKKDLSDLNIDKIGKEENTTSNSVLEENKGILKIEEIMDPNVDLSIRSDIIASSSQNISLENEDIMDLNVDLSVHSNIIESRPISLKNR